MAKGDTKTNQYLDIAANGTRADLPTETCCETRTQTLIRGVAERIMDVEDEVERLENNPDVVDIVDTYADLQNYPTSGLTDKDIVRVIADEEHGGLSSYYRWNSPNPGWNFVGVIPGGDGIKELSSADYNYPTESPDRVALWLLDNGLYTAPAGVMVAASTTSYPWYNTSDKTILVGGSDTVKGIYTFLNGKTDVVTTQVSDGTEADEYTLFKSTQVLQATGQSTTDTISQKAITDALNALPTVNDATLTITQNGTSKGTFTANDADDTTIALTDTTYNAFTGTDGTSAGAAGLVPAPATTDAGKFLKADGTWDSAGGGATYTAGDGIDITNAVISATNTGKAKVLTTDDYNWPTTGTKTSVALWLLEDGVYSFDNLSVRYNSSSSYTTTGMAIVNKATVSSGTGDGLVLYMPTSDPARFIRQIRTNGTGGAVTSVPSLANNLTTVISGFALDASQGKVLNDKIGGDLSNLTTTDKTSLINAINEVAGQGGGVTELTTADYNYPTSGTPDGVALWKLNGGIYIAPVGVKVYRRVSDTGTSAGDTYIIGKVNDYTTIIALRADAHSYRYVVVTNTGADSEVASLLSGTDIVQSTGTSTTTVMSQNAVTRMVFADPADKEKIQIGSGATNTTGAGVAVGLNSKSSATGAVSIGNAAGSSSASSTHALALGTSAVAGQAGSIALGAFSGGSSAITGPGMIHVGTSSTDYGYNSSNYRLLTGLYDGQSAHDAVNLGQLQNAIINGGTTAPTTATVGAVGTLYSYVDTTGTPTPHMMVCTEIDTTDPSNPVYTWQTLV